MRAKIINQARKEYSNHGVVKQNQELLEIKYRKPVSKEVISVENQIKKKQISKSKILKEKIKYGESR